LNRVGEGSRDHGLIMDNFFDFDNKCEIVFIISNNYHILKKKKIMDEIICTLFSTYLLSVQFTIAILVKLCV